jgi:hypothetical protein
LRAADLHLRGQCFCIGFCPPLTSSAALARRRITSCAAAARLPAQVERRQQRTFHGDRWMTSCTLVGERRADAVRKSPATGARRGSRAAVADQGNRREAGESVQWLMISGQTDSADHSKRSPVLFPN